jgi:ABC-type phosphate transport system substrate-binding protein
MKKIIWLLLLFAAFTHLGAVMARAQAVVIANPDVKASSVSKSELRDIFTGAASSFSDGSHASPVLLKAGAVHDEFLSAYVGKNDTAFRASWRNLVFSGQASMPKSLDSESAMVEYVAHNPGAVGYIGKDTPHNGVKVLAVK